MMQHASATPSLTHSTTSAAIGPRWWRRRRPSTWRYLRGWRFRTHRPKNAGKGLRDCWEIWGPSCKIRYKTIVTVTLNLYFWVSHWIMGIWMAKTQRGSKLLVFYRLPCGTDPMRMSKSKLWNWNTNHGKPVSDKPNQNHLYSVH
jgi:hypothetical protein